MLKATSRRGTGRGSGLGARAATRLLAVSGGESPSVDFGRMSATSIDPDAPLSKSNGVSPAELATELAFSNAQLSNHSNMKNKHRITEVDLDFEFQSPDEFSLSDEGVDA